MIFTNTKKYEEEFNKNTDGSKGEIYWKGIIEKKFKKYNILYIYKNYSKNNTIYINIYGSKPDMEFMFYNNVLYSIWIDKCEYLNKPINVRLSEENKKKIFKEQNITLKKLIEILPHTAYPDSNLTYKDFILF